MGNKYVLPLCVCFLCFFSLTAQEKSASLPASHKIGAGKKNYFIKETDKGVALVQRLSWEALEDIYGFEFELDQQDKKTKEWRQIDKQVLKTNYADVSLSPGNYRYRVRVINLLEQREEASNYRNFDIRIAYQPEITSVSPQVINFDEMDSQTLTITGKNFHEETSFTLTNRSGGGVLRGTIAELNPDGKRVIVAFDFVHANPGKYTFAAVDPSALSAEKNDMLFRFQKPIDIFLSGGYFFTGFVANKTLKEYFNTNLTALGGGMRFTVAPFKRYYGFNLTGSGTSLKHKTEGYTVTAGLLSVQLNAAYFLPIIKHRLVFDAHAGLGSSFMVNMLFTYNSKNSYTSPKAWAYDITLNAGTALYIYAYKRLYFEINLDHIIPLRLKSGFPRYIIQPQFGIGWEF